MTLGFSIEVTAEAFINQCAETAMIARGFGIDVANSDHALVNRFVSSVFIGLPCPINTAGIVAIRILFRSEINLPAGKIKTPALWKLSKERALHNY